MPLHPTPPLVVGWTLLLLAATVQGGGIHEPSAGLISHGPVTLNGFGEWTAASGVARGFSQGALEGASLQAEAATIELEWERGLDVGGERSLAKYVTDRGRESIQLRQLDAWFEAFKGTPLFLAFPDGRPMTTTMTSSAIARLTPARDVTVVQVGTAPGAARAADAPDLGFWHVVEGPVVRSEGGDSVRVEGSFSLFVHNVTIHAAGDDGRWSNWTGYRESDPGGPVTEFEARVTVIHVRNGTFSATPQAGLELLAPEVQAVVDGTVASSGATGRLRSHGEILVYDGDPLLLEGRGPLSVASPGTEGTGSGGPPSLWLQPSADLRVVKTPGLQAIPAPDDGSPFGSRARSLPGVALLVLAGGAMAWLGVIPAPTPASRRRRYARWMRRGGEAAGAQDWGRAAACFERATRVKRDEPLGWYEWAYARLESGDYAGAEEVARTAEEVPGIDRLDLLDLRAVAAWQRSDRPAFERHVAQLAMAAPEMAQGLLADLGIDASMLRLPLRSVLDSTGTEGHPDGYA